MDPFAVVGYFIGIAGVVATIYSYFRTRRTKRWNAIGYQMVLIGDNPDTIPQLRVLYNDRPIKHLRQAQVAFWNNGNQTIDQKDIATFDKLRIVAGEDQIFLQVDVQDVTNPSIHFELTPRPGSDPPSVYDITFDYLDPGDGAVIRTLFTGDGEVRLTGKIKGATEAFTAWDRFITSVKRGARNSARSCLAFGVLCAVMALVAQLTIKKRGAEIVAAKTDLLAVSFLIGSMVFVMLALISFYLYSRYVFRGPPMPKLLQKSILPDDRD